ncbi:MAG: hypothetical protein J6J36_00670 [Clostridia bacterium]|nr:hypothetical protein [Clostridia bacterium]
MKTTNLTVDTAQNSDYYLKIENYATTDALQETTSILKEVDESLTKQISIIKDELENLKKENKKKDGAFNKKIDNIKSVVDKLQNEIANLDERYLPIELLRAREYLISTNFKGQLKSKKLINELNKIFDNLMPKKEFYENYGGDFTAVNLARFLVKQYDEVIIRTYIKKLRELEAVQSIISKWS